MLTFFRKHQKIIYSVVAVFIICSFTFFGTASSMGGEKGPKDVVVGKLLGGKKLKSSELKRTERFIASDMYDIELLQKNGFPNAFNDGVLRSDFFGTPLAEKIAVHYFDDIQEELQPRLEKSQRFRPYTHPNFAFLSAEMIWNMWRPEISAHLENLKAQKLVAGAVKTLGQLYVDQGQFPSHFLRQFLLSQEKQHEWIPHDSNLERGDLALCHNHSLEDWVGPRYINICAQLILNGAELAEKRGFKVSSDEARASMIRNAVEFLQYEMKCKEVSQEEISNFMRKNLHVLGMNEQEAVGVWQKVLLFRNLLNNAGSTALLDALPYEQFHRFADEEVLVTHYELPKEFQFSDLLSMLSFQKYIELVGERVQGNSLPKNLRPLSAIAPELREESYQLSYKTVNEDEVALTIGTKNLWDYEMAHYETLLKKCPVAEKAVAASAEEKLQLLEKLNRNVRAKIDKEATQRMIKEHPEWIESALAKAQLLEKKLYLPLKGEVTELAGIPNSAEFLKALEKGQKRVCLDGKTHYEITKAESSQDERVLTFAEAKARGILQQLVRKDLEKAYATVRGKDPASYKNEKGEWKRFDDVFELVAKQHYASLFYTLSKENLEPAEYAQKRLEPFVKEMRKNVLAQRSIDLKGDLESQWQIEKNAVKVARKSIPAWMENEDFTKPGLSKAQTIGFYDVQEKTDSSALLVEPMRQGKELLAQEIKGHVMEQLLKEAPIYSGSRDGA